MIGKSIDNENGVSVNDVGRVQTVLGGFNDAATMIFFHSNWEAPSLNVSAALGGLASDAYTMGYNYYKFVGK